MTKSSVTNTSFHCRAVGWSEEKTVIAHLRSEVFLREQGVPPQDEWDGLDDTAWHFLIRQNGEVIGCARVVPDLWLDEPALHIGRVAIARPFRHRGAGTALMRYILQWCRRGSRAHKRVYLHAQKSVIPFYRRLDFVPVGEDFLDAGIVHTSMIHQPTDKPL